MADNAFNGDANPGSRLHRLRAWLARGSFVRYARTLMEQLRRLDGALATRFPRLHHLLGNRAARAELLARIERRARPAALVAASLSMLVAVWFVYHVYLDRSGVPDFEEFVRFEVPGIGEVFDTKGRVLIELAHEYRRPVTYDEIPLVMRQAILSAEDKSFFKHSGVDYTSLPRMVAKTVRYTWEAWWAKREHGLNPVFRQGGSTPHPAAGSPLFPARPDGPRERERPLPGWVGPAGHVLGDGRAGHQPARGAADRRMARGPHPAVANLTGTRVSPFVQSTMSATARWWQPG